MFAKFYLPNNIICCRCFQRGNRLDALCRKKGKSLALFSLTNNARAGQEKHFSTENAEKKQNSTKKAASNFAYFKAYCWAMVGDYEKLYGLHLEEEYGKSAAGKWANADQKIVDEVLLRLYNFEKRLMVAALALLYFSFLGFLLAAIVYFRQKSAAITKKRRDEYLEGRTKRWEMKFGNGIMDLEGFLRRHSISGEKIRKASLYDSPNANGLLIFEIEENSAEGGKNFDETAS